MTSFSAPPLDPLLVTMDIPTGRMQPAGPTLVRRMTDLRGLFADEDAWTTAATNDDPVVYEVCSSPVPELPRELPHSITTIYPGVCGDELYMTKGHQHPDPQGEIYLGLSGVGGLLMFDGQRTEWLELRTGSIGYIPPGWAHRSVNTHDEPYQFLAVYPGSAGHDYSWVLRHGMGARVHRRAGAVELIPDPR